MAITFPVFIGGSGRLKLIAVERIFGSWGKKTPRTPRPKVFQKVPPLKKVNQLRRETPRVVWAPGHLPRFLSPFSAPALKPPKITGFWSKALSLKIFFLFLLLSLSFSYHQSNRQCNNAKKYYHDARKGKRQQKVCKGN